MITWKRIGLKNLTFPKVEPYNREYITNHENLPEKVLLKKTNKDEAQKINDNINYDEVQGLGKEFIFHIEEFYNSGITLHLSKNTKLNNPITIKYHLDSNNSTLVDYNIIFAEAGSEATVIIDYTSDSALKGFHNGLTKVYAKENSIVNIIKLQRLNNESQSFDSNLAFVEGQGQVNWISIEVGSGLSGANFTTYLNGEASVGNLSSIYLGDGTRKMDLGYTMIHKGIRSNSTIESKGVLMDEAKKVFRGNLYFKHGSRLSKGSEEEYVILLDPKVKSDSIPGLFCEEDDVQGAHAASAGQLNKDKLFYLMSRGLSERQAKKLIIESSFRPIIDKIPLEDIRQKITEEIERRI